MLNKQEFVKSVYKLEHLPKLRLPEVILCGRSNAGKSTFINSLFNRKDLAKTSSTPGKTRSINYYNIDDKFYIVDLPGFGYAKTSKTEREYWSKLIGDFIHESDHIKLALHFIDSRHQPSELDLHLNLLLNNEQIPYLFILTKADKLKQSEYKNSLARLKENLPEIVNDENVIFFSSVKKRGKREILNLFTEIFY